MSESYNSDLSFSQRYGYKPAPQPLQTEELTPSLRNELCAVINEEFEASTACRVNGPNIANWHKVLQQYWVRKLGRPYEQFNISQCLDYNILRVIRGCPFHKVLELIEDLLNLVGDKQLSFHKAISEVLHRHQAPYILKMVETNKWWIIQTGTPYEREVVENTFEWIQNPIFNYTRIHLEKAGHELAKGEYTSSVDNSLKALEACLRTVSGEPNKTGGDALKEYDKNHSIPFPLRKMIEGAWIYRNDAPGIGHAIKKGKCPPPDRWDAQVLYVVGCGFISYLINRKNTNSNASL